MTNQNSRCSEVSQTQATAITPHYQSIGAFCIMAFFSRGSGRSSTNILTVVGVSLCFGGAIALTSIQFFPAFQDAIQERVTPR
jgi:hypothetical protein